MIKKFGNKDFEEKNTNFWVIRQFWKTNLNADWIDFKKSYNMVTLKWMVKSLYLNEAADNTLKLF